MFIMSAAWHRSNPCSPVPQRLAESLAESAISITITSVTDALSFAIGCWTTLPGVWMFCSYASVAILFDYLYQVTFFAGIMAVSGDFEAQGRHCLFLYKVRSHRNLKRPKSGMYLSGTCETVHPHSAHGVTHRNLAHTLWLTPWADWGDCEDNFWIA